MNFASVKPSVVEDLLVRDFSVILEYHQTIEELTQAILWKSNLGRKSVVDLAESVVEVEET